MSVILRTHREMTAERPPLEYLADGIIPRHSTGAIIGPSGHGKSFFLAAFAYHVATGRDFMGRRVIEGDVVVCVAEGVHGLRQRLVAIATDMRLGDDVPRIRFVEVPLPFTDPQAMAGLADAIRAQGLQPALTIFDTLAAHQVTGFNESETSQMQAAANGMVAYQRIVQGCVIAAHHTGWDASRERGSTALRGSVDFMYSLEKKGERFTLRCTKSRDFAPPEPMALRLAQVGESCVMRLAEAGESLALSPMQRQALAELHAAGRPMRYTDWWKLSGIGAKSTFSHIRLELVTAGVIRQTPEATYEITPAGQAAMRSEQGPRSNAGPTQVQLDHGEQVQQVSTPIRVDLGPTPTKAGRWTTEHRNGTRAPGDAA